MNLSPFPHSLFTSSSFPHSLFISSQPGCKAATIRAALDINSLKTSKYCVAFLLTKQLDSPKGMLNALLENRLPSGHYDGVKYISPESR